MLTKAYAGILVFPVDLSTKRKSTEEHENYSPFH